MLSRIKEKFNTDPKFKKKVVIISGFVLVFILVALVDHIT